MSDDSEEEQQGDTLRPMAGSDDAYGAQTVLREVPQELLARARDKLLSAKKRTSSAKPLVPKAAPIPQDLLGSLDLGGPEPEAAPPSGTSPGPVAPKPTPKVPPKPASTKPPLVDKRVAASKSEPVSARYSSVTARAEPTGKRRSSAAPARSVKVDKIDPLDEGWDEPETSVFQPAPSERAAAVKPAPELGEPAKPKAAPAPEPDATSAASRRPTRRERRHVPMPPEVEISSSPPDEAPDEPADSTSEPSSLLPPSDMDAHRELRLSAASSREAQDKVGFRPSLIVIIVALMGIIVWLLLSR